MRYIYVRGKVIRKEIDCRVVLNLLVLGAANSTNERVVSR